MAQNNGPLIIGGVAVVVAVVGGALLISQQAPVATNTNTTSSSISSTSSAVLTTSSESSVQTTALRDGTYRATGNYVSPGGAESIEVELTINNGVITAVNVISNASNPTSVNYQSLFISGIRGEVVGKSLDSVNVGRVNGSSLTGGGFNQAVNNILQQARGS